MFHVFDIPQWTNVGIFNVILLCVLVAGVNCFYFKRQLASFKRTHDKSIFLLEKQLKMVSSASLGMGERLLSLEKRLSDLSHTQEQLKSADLEFSFTQATKLLDQGLSADAIAANSGLSVSEVSLMELIRNESSGEAEETTATRKSTLFTAHA